MICFSANPDSTKGIQGKREVQCVYRQTVWGIQQQHEPRGEDAEEVRSGTAGMGNSGAVRHGSRAQEKAVSQFTYAAVGTSPLGTAGGSSVPSLGWGGQRGSSLLQVAGRWINILTRVHGRQ